MKRDIGEGGTEGGGGGYRIRGGGGWSTLEGDDIVYQTFKKSLSYRYSVLTYNFHIKVKTPFLVW